MRSMVGSMVRSTMEKAFVLGRIARKMCFTYPHLGPSRSVKQPHTEFTLRRGCDSGDRTSWDSWGGGQPGSCWKWPG